MATLDTLAKLPMLAAEATDAEYEAAIYAWMEEIHRLTAGEVAVILEQYRELPHQAESEKRRVFNGIQNNSQMVHLLLEALLKQITPSNKALVECKMMETRMQYEDVLRSTNAGVDQTFIRLKLHIDGLLQKVSGAIAAHSFPAMPTTSSSSQPSTGDSKTTK